MDSNKTETRIKRARDRADQLEYTPVNDDGSVVVCDPHHSDSVHTLVGSELHCSCADATYRSDICYHLIGLILFGPDQAQQVAQEALTDEMRSIQDEATSLRAELRKLDEQARSIRAIREEISESTEELPSIETKDELVELVEQVTN